MIEMRVGFARVGIAHLSREEQCVPGSLMGFVEQKPSARSIFSCNPGVNRFIVIQTHSPVFQRWHRVAAVLGHGKLSIDEFSAGISHGQTNVRASARTVD
jgi:hypothetical protein